MSRRKYSESVLSFPLVRGHFANDVDFHRINAVIVKYYYLKQLKFSFLRDTCA